MAFSRIKYEENRINIKEREGVRNRLPKTGVNTEA